MVIGEQIRRHREAAGLSQDDLAARVLVSRPTISHWETGKTMPDAQSLLLLAQLFDTTIDELVKGDVDEMRHTVEREVQVQRGLSVGLAVLTLTCTFGLVFTALWAREYVELAARVVGAVLSLAFTWTLFRRQSPAARTADDMGRTLGAVAMCEGASDAPRILDDVATDGVRDPALRLALSFAAAVLIAVVLIALVGILVPGRLT